ncbi:hypothetical protein MKW98_014104, partial [Papaver atlanticum]
ASTAIYLFSIGGLLDDLENIVFTMGLKNKKLQKGKKNSLSGAAATGAGEDR